MSFYWLISILVGYWFALYVLSHINIRRHIHPDLLKKKTVLELIINKFKRD